MNVARPAIPVWHLYGESRAFPDILHVERIRDRAAGLDWVIAPHRHLHLHQVFLLLSGEIAVSIDGVEHHLDLPAAINLPRTVVHGFRFSANTEGYVLTIPAGDFPELFEATAETAAGLAVRFTVPAPPTLAARFETVERIHDEASPFRRTRLRAEVGSIACDLLLATGGLAGGEAADLRIDRFRDLVRRTLGERLTIEDYAGRLGLSPRHLSRICHAATGLSAQGYVEAERVREACRLLVYTRMTIQSVAFALGFDDPAYFSRAFQRGTGLSPTAYRQRFEQPLA